MNDICYITGKTAMQSAHMTEIKREKAIRLAITLGWLGGTDFTQGKQ